MHKRLQCIKCKSKNKKNAQEALDSKEVGFSQLKAIDSTEDQRQIAKEG